MYIRLAPIVSKTNGEAKTLEIKYTYSEAKEMNKNYI